MYKCDETTGQKKPFGLHRSVRARRSDTSTELTYNFLTEDTWPVSFIEDRPQNLRARATGLQQLFHEWHLCMSFKLCKRFAWLGRFSVATGDCQWNEERNEKSNKDFKTETFGIFFTMIKDKKRANFMASVSIMIANWAWWTCAPSYLSVSLGFSFPKGNKYRLDQSENILWCQFGYNFSCRCNLQFRTFILNWHWLFLNLVHAFSLFRIMLKETRERFKEFTQTWFKETAFETLVNST